jgi:hypothetical protein
LGRHHSHDDIIRTLCERAGWPWKKARHFVQRVEVDHHDKIVARQSPLLIALGVGSLVAGVLMAAGGGYLTFTGEVSELSLGLLFTGPGFFVGGIAGVWRAVSVMRE